MKKTRLLKMVLLYISTLGLYEGYWLVSQRDSLVIKTKSYIPSKLWIIGSYIIMAIGLLAVLAILLFSIQPTELLILILMALLSLVSLIRLWWMWHFLKAASVVTIPRVTLGWLLLHLLLVGFSPIFIIQFYLNRRVDPKQIKPTNRFVYLSILLFVTFTAVFFAIGYVSASQQMTGFDDVILEETQEMKDLIKKADKLNRLHKGCVQKLDSNYEFITDENTVGYDNDYNKCEAILIEQHKAVDDYNALVKSAQLQ